MVNKDRSRDRTLGMDRVIDRRDFLNGVAIGAAGLTAAMNRQPANAAALTVVCMRKLSTPSLAQDIRPASV